MLYNLGKERVNTVKIVKLVGGLGHQMFIYAFGLTLIKKYKKDIYFDKTHFKNKHVYTPRDYELGVFPDLQIKFKKKPRLIPFHKTNEKETFVYDENLFKSHFNEHWTGYFQNEKYFADIKQDVCRAFKFPEFDKDDKFNRDWAKKIKAHKNSVFIHVRRGDYVGLDGWLLKRAYYRRAVKYIQNHVNNPHFFVFSDADAAYIKKNFHIGCDYEYIGTHNADNNQSFRDMQLMSLCQNAIIANSSFSWWGAWLQKNKNHVVCAPTPWLNSNDDIICDNWVKISRK